nr:MAG TPA: hypothetical protein [Caudoviricetes sp.]
MRRSCDTVARNIETGQRRQYRHRPSRRTAIIAKIRRVIRGRE